ncbi:disulfide bond formation protein B [Rhizorhapis sp. SPR117]|uniref:disulfide bond formation protein B n=1 Tax=Rhizorhapis sp. SPR117 TaxID=2912611 RepID=UPI001F1E946A|nr:disulfide bond formation protein B [Rhizorhapis sp. SPR117]
MRGLTLARLIALIAPTGLLGGALLSQYVGGLAPCEMCYWQRWPHAAAIIFALFAILLRGGAAGRFFLILAALSIAISGGIGVFHAGVEYGWWEGLTACSTSGASDNTQDILNSIMATPLVRCDVPQWTLLGISLAGYNAILSLGAAVTILILMTGRRRKLS